MSPMLAGGGGVHTSLCTPQSCLLSSHCQPVPANEVQVSRGFTPVQLTTQPRPQEVQPNRVFASCYTLAEFDPAALCGSELGSTSITNLLYCCDSTRESTSSSCDEGELAACSSFHCGSTGLQHTCKFASLAAGWKQPWQPYRLARSEPGSQEGRGPQQGAGWSRFAAATGGRLFDSTNAPDNCRAAAGWRGGDGSSGSVGHAIARVSGNQSLAAISSQPVDDVHGHVQGCSSRRCSNNRRSASRQERVQAVSRSAGSAPVAAAVGFPAGSGNVRGRSSAGAGGCASLHPEALRELSNMSSIELRPDAGLGSLGALDRPAEQPVEDPAKSAADGSLTDAASPRVPGVPDNACPTATLSARGSSRISAWKLLFAGCLGF